MMKEKSIHVFHQIAGHLYAHLPVVLIRNAVTVRILTHFDDNKISWYVSQYVCHVLQYTMVCFSHIMTALLLNKKNCHRTALKISFYMELLYNNSAPDKKG